jgi:succinate dehydrogenase / fumarate reductase, cytochrome b subunit
MADGERVVRGGVPAPTVVLDFLRSSVGAKVIMALTGAALWGFVIIHLLGNLQMFQGADAINGYGVMLRAIFHGAAVWAARAGLLLAFVVHIAMGMRLAALNRAARGPVGYQKKKPLRTTFAALTMTWSGALIFTFLVFHLAHFAWGLVDPSYFSLHDEKDRHDIYKMVWTAFKNPVFVVVYIAGQTVVLAHLFHGTASLWQSVGFHHGTWSPALRVAGRSIAALIFLGNAALPLAIFFAWGAP